MSRIDAPDEPEPDDAPDEPEPDDAPDEPEPDDAPDQPEADDAPDEPEAEVTDDAPAPKLADEQNIQESIHNIRAEATKKYRCIVTCMNPQKSSVKSISVDFGNAFFSVSELVIFDVPEGIWISKVVLEHLQDATYVSRSDEEYQVDEFKHSVRSVLLPEYSINVLDSE